ncbi:MAG TPA: hypothetical protein PLK13_09945 [Xanthobacteraceae bacterium]|jgi:hypothetical protein|nr:hypothetical protein [Xanthobacteraceae bacterium]HQS44887.1 hypothetical protein [Xanthobacteraceae bacterium]
MERTQVIGRELQTLARAFDTTPSYVDFKQRLRAQHDLGLFPDDRLVRAVAMAIQRDI